MDIIICSSIKSCHVKIKKRALCPRQKKHKAQRISGPHHRKSDQGQSKYDCDVETTSKYVGEEGEDEGGGGRFKKLRTKSQGLRVEWRMKSENNFHIT